MALETSYLHVGDILGAHGLKGTLILYSHTRPASAVAGYSCWWLGESAEAATPYRVNRCWQHGKKVLAEIDGVTDCNSAELLKGKKIWVPLSEVEVDEDEYLWDELIGCKVVLEEGSVHLGTVVALEEYGAQDNLIVRTPEDAAVVGEWVIPFIEDIIADVDIEEGCITVDLPEGMDACFTPRS